MIINGKELPWMVPQRHPKIMQNTSKHVAYLNCNKHKLTGFVRIIFTRVSTDVNGWSVKSLPISLLYTAKKEKKDTQTLLRIFI